MHSCASFNIIAPDYDSCDAVFNVIVHVLRQLGSCAKEVNVRIRNAFLPRGCCEGSRI